MGPSSGVKNGRSANAAYLAPSAEQVIANPPFHAYIISHDFVDTVQLPQSLVVVCFITRDAELIGAD